MRTQSETMRVRLRLQFGGGLRILQLWAREGNGDPIGDHHVDKTDSRCGNIPNVYDNFHLLRVRLISIVSKSCVCARPQPLTLDEDVVASAGA